MPLPTLKNEFQICAFPLFHFASCWLFHSTWGIFARVSRAVAVGVFICNYQEARLGNIFFPFRFPSLLLFAASQARRSTKESVELAAGCNCPCCQALFCGNPANELHLIVNLCVCFRPPTPSPSPFPSRTFYNFLLLCTCVV